MLAVIKSATSSGAHIGVRARPFSYAVRGLDAPSQPVAVVLTGPDGDRWAWDEEAEETITGPALDFWREAAADSRIEKSLREVFSANAVQLERAAAIV